MKFDPIQLQLLQEIAGLHAIPTGAYSIRANGEMADKNSTSTIDIVSKADKSGIDIYIKDNTKKESLHMPVILSQTGLEEIVYNDFHVGENCDITIIAGCGIHNGGDKKSRHDGIHTFYVGKNSKVKYIEKHYGKGEGTGDIVMNPQTIVHMEENSYLEMETVQIKGVDSTDRLTKGTLGDNATFVVKEKIMTHGTQFAKTRFEVELDGFNSSTNVISRSVARDNSYQEFLSVINGNNKCMGHSECDAIIMDKATVKAVPEITANHIESSLIHEAAIGKIAGEQIIKLMTLGLTEEEAEAQIINGFLK